MGGYITRAAMEAEVQGIYEVLPPQFRDRLSLDVRVSAQNAQIFRRGFNLLPRLVDDLFAQLKYKEGTVWPFWKLVAAFYLVEKRIGPNSSRRAGEQVYSTMPWPPEVHSLSDALAFTQQAYFESHMHAPKELAGCWRVESSTASRLVLVDETPYPDSLTEGVVAGICHAFSRQGPAYTVLDEDKAKRAGGTVTRYEVVFKRQK
jgi:hypothetical protein